MKAINTIKDSSRCAEKSCKGLMMMKVAKLGWVGADVGKEQGWGGAGLDRSRAKWGRSRERQKQRRSKNGVGAG